ncbi:hypothetical protein [Massilia litorea]|jgi:uncharacterized membrane protein (UPF0136 family)|uniref:Uncharacterized protein n=1 Tax=Massilia litorea TaxID=2769491 RepID=A0A7L9TY63_9BURK|nr:hypothetical protein [Massilia litorea]QOL47723.1 hypothetical protein LPB04_11820 [Massilia litorea]
MRILAAVQAIFALAFLAFGAVALFGIGITGLLFLVPGAIFAVTASLAQEGSRGAVMLAFGVDAVLATMSAHTLERALGTSGSARLFDWLPAAAALALVGIGVLAVLMDWRALRKAPWF